jgi:uncharacterized membrane protein
VIRFYAKRLQRDLKRWHEKGWVTGEGYQAIQIELARDPKLAASAALASIGAILLGFAAISFVAANWNVIPRLARLAMLIAALWTAYGAAAWLYKRELPNFAQAAVLTGALFFGAAVMLVSQMYHIDSDNLPGFMLLWTGGAALAGLLFRSSLTLGAAMILASAWNMTELATTPDVVQWRFLPVWAALTAAIGWNRSGIGLHLAAAALVAWLIPIGQSLPSHPHTLVAAIGAAGVLAAGAVMAASRNRLARQVAIRAIPYAAIVSFAGLLPQDLASIVPKVEVGLAIAAAAGFAYVLLSQAMPRLQPAAPLLFAYALGVAFYGLMVVQFGRPAASLPTMVIAAALTFAILAGGLICGIQVRSRLLMWLAFAGLVTETLTLYFDKLGDLINTSLFFLLAGAGIFGLAWVLMRFGGAPVEQEARS